MLGVIEKKKYKVRIENGKKIIDNNLLQNVSDFMFLCTIDGTFLDCYVPNNGFPLINDNDVIGKKIDEVLPRNLSDNLYTYFDQVFESGKVQIREFKLQTEKLHKHYEVRLSPIKENKILCIVKDNTSTYQAKSDLLEYKERLEFALIGGELGLWDWNLQTNETIYNDKWAEMLGYTVKEIEKIEKVYDELIHEEDLHRAKGVLQRHLNGHIPIYECEVRMRLKSGDWKWILIKGKVVEWDEEGNALRMTGTNSDIHDRKLAEESLKYRVLQLAVVARLGQKALSNRTTLDDLMEDALLNINLTLNVEYCAIMELQPENKKLLLRSGIGWEEKKENKQTVDNNKEFHFGYVLHSNEPIIVQDFALEKRFKISGWLKKKKITSGISVIIKRRGRPYGILGVYSKLKKNFNRDDVNFVQSVSNIIAEAIEHRSYEEKLNMANKEMETFLYKSSHNLKGPSASIAGLVQIAKYDVEDPLALNYLNLISQSTKRLEINLEELQNITRIKQGNISCAPIDFRQIVDDVVKGLEYLPGFDEVDIETRISSKIEYSSDKLLVHSIIQNLIENAIKYRRANVNSFVKVRINSIKSDIKIQVSDNGIGVPKHLEDEIFEMFVRATETSKGTGLGLYIVKEAVSKLCGTISMKSGSEKGTTFTVIIPSCIDLDD